MKNYLIRQTLVWVVLFNCTSNIYAQTLTLQLTPSNYNGFAISCFGGRDGSIDLTVTGGTAPYTYEWSNDQQTEDISNLPAQYYRVHVVDANGIEADGEITLTEPEQLRIEVSLYEYPNLYNISLFGACNGIATLTLSGGVTPFNFLWNDGSTNQNRSNLCARNYGVVVTDANGCEISSERIYLTQPPENNWKQTGNANTNSSTDFIGTTDALDLVLKTNSIERMRLKSNGELNISSLSGSGNRMIVADADGKLIAYPCFPWSTCGNNLLGNDFFGSLNNVDVVVKSNSQEVVRFKTSGDIVINKFSQSADGLLYNTAGWIDKIDFTNPNDVLRGDGTFGALPGGAGYWALSGSNHLYNTNSSGRIGIGTITPSEKLQVTDGSIYLQGENQGLIVDAQSDKRVGLIKYSGREAGIWRTSSQDFEIGRVNVSALPGTPSSFTTDLYIDGNGKVGIGTTPPASGNYFLFVTGGIATRDVKVQATGWPDYIFDTSYQPISIYELEQFIKQNKHLPGIPSAKEVEENDGYELGSMVQKLLEKTEEQSLYIIEQQKQIDELKLQVKKLERRK
ncbi:MAG: hypothetical protein ACHQNT_04875 [Bacteroidia bacterium]